ncbi:hypothetical protein HY418_00425 [Candidatus Kaiserbacteria bacterium]|nr:hypothetical protein [Candidatus Kaiserbacteria bacterium]
MWRPDSRDERWEIPMKLIVTLIIGFLLLMGKAAFAQPVHVVTGPERLGGSPYEFLAKMRAYRADGVKVVIGDKCISSCTLYTALLRDDLICAKPGAKFVFHRFVLVDNIKVDGQGRLQSFHIMGPLTGPMAQQLWMTYPYRIRHQIMKRSGIGLPRVGNELTIPARQLGVPTC